LGLNLYLPYIHLHEIEVNGSVLLGLQRDQFASQVRIDPGMDIFQIDSLTAERRTMIYDLQVEVP